MTLRCRFPVNWGKWISKKHYYRHKCDELGIPYSEDETAEELRLKWYRERTMSIRKARLYGIQKKKRVAWGRKLLISLGKRLAPKRYYRHKCDELGIPYSEDETAEELRLKWYRQRALDIKNTSLVSRRNKKHLNPIRKVVHK